ncbi:MULTISPECIES: YitT family protein [unclassified Facklamia]|uniref:YitT family protein n=1 Tax=Aerococcaceae TaxID=186827 RepID=UPI0019355A44|nr:MULTISPECIES: YitT family protein [unclassified Facklamia]MBS4461752.1 YitT family protein [Aerococcaceae bacterium zg-B36]QQD66276.1 YitT family protein [Aerococcaceae bacterium zg-252]
MKKINQYLNMETPAIIFSLCLITIGCLLYAVGVNSFIIPNRFGNGGVAGIAILIFYVFSIPTGTTNLIVNAVLMIIGWKFIEKRTLIFTVYALVMMSWFLNIIHPPAFVSSNILVTAIAAGVVIGSSLGIVVRGNGTTAGTDLIAVMLKKYFGINFSISVFLINLIIVFSGTSIIGLENAIVTLIMKFISSYMIDLFTEGFNRRKSLMIISEKQEEVATEIINKLGRGLTILKGYGYYTHREKDVLYVIVSRHQVVQIQRIISEIDPLAFVTISDVQQVIGQGFTFFNPTNKNKKFYN